MDPLSDMLGGIRAEGASVREAELSVGMTVDDGAPLTMVTVIRGGGSAVLADGTVLGLGAGDTALVRGPEPFRLDGGGDTVVIIGVYRATRPRHERLLRTLPPALVLHDENGVEAWLGAIRDAIDCGRWMPGGQALVDRIMDWGLVCTLGCWFEQEGADAPAWYRGAADPVVGPALEAVHDRPHDPWSVEALAATAAVSRAHFAKRFTEVMGRPPLDYVTEWRMDLAEELLSDPDMSVAHVAKAVGYRDPFAFSTAFKRRRGVSPRDYRAVA